MRFFILLFLAYSTQVIAQQQALKVYSENTEKSVFIYTDNDKPYPQSVKLTVDFKGLKLKEEIPEFLMVPANSTKFLLTELVIPQGRAWGYNFKFSYFMGDVNAEHDDDYVYMLPYEEGKGFKVAQGYNGKSSHVNENALDFNLPAGEPILAARPGKVVKLKEDSDRGCPNKSCANLGNYVTIMHDDGSFADYYHLKQNGVLVALGDEVERGQSIGLTGNTGWATGYHLHFLVYLPHLSGRKTLVTQFKTKQGPVQPLLELKTYRSIK